MQTSPTFAPKPHYTLLDALRGLAAILVVWFHLTEFMNPGTWPLFHGYLAVDFFFGLSGFVIAYAYDSRWASGLTTGGFLKRRIIRLQPLVFFGMTLGTALYYFSGSPMYAGVATTSVGLLLLTSLANAFMIPMLPQWNVRGFGEVTSVNAPVWSLMYEYVANLLYALIFRRVSTRVLAIFVALFGLYLIDAGMGLDTFGLGVAGDEYYSLVYGYKFTGQHVYVAMARVLYPFFMGALIARLLHHRQPATDSSWIGRNGYWLTGLLLAAALCAPRMGEVGSWQEGLYNTLAVLLLFPLILVLGAKSQLLGQRTERICKWLGDISYPLYITHYPIVYVYLAWWDRDREVVSQHPDVWWLVMVSTFLLCLGVAWAALRLYDLPVRSWLQKHWR